jgi:hypothetical protein
VSEGSQSSAGCEANANEFYFRGGSVCRYSDYWLQRWGQESQFACRIYFHNTGIIRHNVVALAPQAEQLVNSGDAAAIDRAAIQTDMSALGRFLITKKETDIASFQTPDIRNVLLTGPYFHDGSQETLWDVADHYNKGDGLQNSYLDQDIQPLALTESDIDDLVAFMASLTSADYKETGDQGAGTPAGALPDEAAPARYLESVRAKTASAQAASTLSANAASKRGHWRTSETSMPSCACDPSRMPA